LKTFLGGISALLLFGACNSAPVQSAGLNVTHVPLTDTQRIPDRPADIDTIITFIQSGPRCDCEVSDSDVNFSADSSVLTGDTGNVLADTVSLQQQ
jgi:hypothetical protein